MDTYIIFISFLLLISILTVIVWLISVKISKDREIEFVISKGVLFDIIDLYKESILLSRIKVLALQYDLHDKSPTNSIQAFERAKNELIKDTVKEIIKDYLSKTSIKTLLRHYKIDGLSLLIITHLKR